MNKNLIEGRSGWVSWHNTAKPFDSIREVNEAVVWWRHAFLPGEISGSSDPEKSAEVVLVRRKPGTVQGPSKRRNRKS